MSRNVSNTDDVIDSRDVIARIDGLQAEQAAYDETGDTVPWEEAEPDNAEELAALLNLHEQGEGFADWEHGKTLVRDSYFEDYAQQLAEDCGMMRDSDSWPYTCIDWERAARELQYDYTSVYFDGVTYWGRS